MSLVNRAISSDEPWSEKLARSRLIVRRKKTLRMSKSVNCMTAATSTSCRNMKKPFKATPSITSPIKSRRLLKLSLGKYSVDIGLNKLVSIQAPWLDRPAPGAMSCSRRVIRRCRSFEQAPAFPKFLQPRIGQRAVRAAGARALRARFWRLPDVLLQVGDTQR